MVNISIDLRKDNTERQWFYAHSSTRVLDVLSRIVLGSNIWTTFIIGRRPFVPLKKRCTWVFVLVLTAFIVFSAEVDSMPLTLAILDIGALPWKSTL